MNTKTKSRKQKMLLCLALAIIAGGCASPQASPQMRAMQQAREQYVQQHPDLSQAKKETILKGDVQVGLTKDEVRASWGQPANIGKFNGKETWYYGTYLLQFNGDVFSQMVVAQPL